MFLIRTILPVFVLFSALQAGTDTKTKLTNVIRVNKTSPSDYSVTYTENGTSKTVKISDWVKSLKERGTISHQDCPRCIGTVEIRVVKSKDGQSAVVLEEVMTGVEVTISIAPESK